ncbi:MurR/RpiR family transcriptional regulator [Carnobacterium gallinarum]|uniref:MurR/RpiR family transcriptional regulator n=1 Tax=Carnobacterium gallinarum TaxID=2749 RepID=UPI000AD23C83|nr:MurR/RpiR family transcriptional regulator [Carnobacterium gallinarum]
MTQPHYFDYSKGKNLSDIEHDILAFLIKDSQNETMSSIRYTAKELATSTATIIRLCKKLGFSGYTEFATHLRLEHLKQHPTIAMEQVDLDFTTRYQDYLVNYQKTLLDMDAMDMLAFQQLLTTSLGILITAENASSTILAHYLQLKLQEKGFHATVLPAQETSLSFNNKIEEMGLLLVLAEHPADTELTEKLHHAQTKKIPIVGFSSAIAKESPYTIGFMIATETPISLENSFNSNLILVLDVLLAII